jgi:transcription elongation factor S-II
MTKNYRNICKNKFKEIINDEKLVSDIEKSINDYTHLKCLEKKYGQGFDCSLFRTIYKNRCMSLYLNLDENSYIQNPNFLKRIKSGELSANKIAFYSPQVVFPEHWKKYMDQQKAKDELEYSKSMGTTTDMYKCGLCKNNKTSYTRLQVRSCDEPMTTFVRCLTCGNEWKFSN